MQAKYAWQLSTKQRKWLAQHIKKTVTPRLETLILVQLLNHSVTMKNACATFYLGHRLGPEDAVTIDALLHRDSPILTNPETGAVLIKFNLEWTYGKDSLTWCNTVKIPLLPEEAEECENLSDDWVQMLYAINDQEAAIIAAVGELEELRRTAKEKLDVEDYKRLCAYIDQAKRIPNV